MEKKLTEILVCPLCKVGLGLSIKEESEQEIVTGSLYCPKCQQSYPIVDAIPNMLPPNLRET